MKPIPTTISLAVLAFVKYYSQFRYPELKDFEAYYVQKMEINDTFDKIQLTWALPKQPKVVTVSIERFK